jgi:hypothetical protein
VAASVASLTQASASTGNVTINVPTGVTAGDLLVAIAFSDPDGSYAAMTAPTGWTIAADSSSVSASGTNGFGKVYTKTATGSEGSTYVFPASGSSTNMVEVLRITGANTSTPFAAAAVTYAFHTAAATNNLVAPSVTLAVPGQLLCGFIGYGGSGTTVISQPTGLFGTSFVTANTFGCMLVAGSNPGTGATGTKTATNTDQGLTGTWGYLTVSMAIADAGTVQTATATQTHTIGQTATATRGRVATSTNVNTIVQSATATTAVTKQITASNSFAVAQTAAFQVTTRLADASQTFSIDQLADSVVTRTFYLTTPSYKQRFTGPPRHRLWDRVSFDVGYSLIIAGSRINLVVNPDPADIEAADYAFIGGHKYVISEAVAIILQNAGYARWITNNINEPIPDVDFSQYGTGPYGTGPYGD